MQMRLILPLVAFLSLAVFPACLGDLIVDDISTELTITSPGPPGVPLEIRKRFRFSHDPADARGVYFSTARLQILSPLDANLSFIHRLEIYALHPTEGPILLAAGEGYTPEDRVVPLEVLYDQDLRGFATDDSRITFIFQVEPSSWSRPYPEGGFTALAHASIEIDI